MRLSIIIPVYNVEQYIGKCIASLLNQNLPVNQYEMIFVDDGSTDGSLQNLTNAVVGKENVKVFSHENRGPGFTRNFGLSQATGDYIWFVDSDDWIKENCLQMILDHIENHGSPDVVALSYVLTDCALKEQYYIAKCNSESCDGMSWLLGDFQQPTQFYILKRSFLLANRIAFLDEIYHEDFEYTPRMLYHAKSVVPLNTPLYYLFRRPNSITTSINPKKAFDLILVANSLHRFSGMISSKPIKRKLCDLICLAINNALANLPHMGHFDEIRLTTELYSSRELLACFRGSTKIKYRIEGILFSIFPRKILSIYSILKRIG